MDAIYCSWGFGYYKKGRKFKELCYIFRDLLKRQDGTYGMLITKETIKDAFDPETIEED